MPKNRVVTVALHDSFTGHVDVRKLSCQFDPDSILRALLVCWRKEVKWENHAKVETWYQHGSSPSAAIVIRLSIPIGGSETIVWLAGTAISEKDWNA